MSSAHAIAARTDIQDNTTNKTVYELSPAEAEWLAWYHRTSGQSADDIEIRIVTPKKPRPVIPGTSEQKATWIHEFDGTGNPLAAIIQISRYFAIHGVWPDGLTGLPAVPKGLSEIKRKWLHGQSNWSKYLKWLGEVDPAAYDEYIEHHYTGRKWDIEHNGLAPAAVDEDPVEQEVSEGMRRLKLKRLRHSLCVDASELRVWFRDNVGAADDATWLANFQKLKAISEQIAEMDADALLVTIKRQPPATTRRQRERLERLNWIADKFRDELPDERVTHTGTTLAERIQARRDRRAQQQSDEPLRDDDRISLTELGKAAVKAMQLVEC